MMEEHVVFRASPGSALNVFKNSPFLTAVSHGVVFIDVLQENELRLFQ
jgi:hypothetical protein